MTTDTDSAGVRHLHPVPDAPDAPLLSPPETPGSSTAAVWDDPPERRRDIIASQWRPANIKTTVAIIAGKRLYQCAYHGVRLPAHALTFAVCAARGASRLTRRLMVWWHVPHLHALESMAVAAGRAGHHDAMRAHEVGKKTRATRGTIVALCAGGALILLVIALAVLPWYGWAVLLAAGFTVLVRHGRPEGKPIIGAAIVAPRYEPPTPEIITRALNSLGIRGINDVIKDGRRLDFITDVHRDGPGWGVQLDLPHGVTAVNVIAKRVELASGLRRPLSATWPAEVPEVHTGRLDLWVAFQDMAKAKQPPWPLLRSGQADMFGAIPFGTDPRQRNVSVPMFEVNWLIGASPGQGKTGAVRVLGCAAALDPLADVWVHELAGKGDLDLSRICHRYCSGIDDEAIAYAAESFRLLRRETERRSERFKKLKGTGVMPDGKVTRELAAKYRDLRPLVAIFDEVQNLFMHPEFKDSAKADAAYVIRVGRAYGIIAVLSTQRPNDESVPAAVSGLIICRYCLMVPGHIENDMVLGTSAFKNGYKATMFRPKVDAGMGWLKGGEDGIPQVVKGYYLNLKTTERVIARARALREAAGVLSGYALGEDDDDTGARDVLSDVLSVFSLDPGLHWETLAERLATRIPGRWADATPDSVSAQCRGLGVPSVQVKVAGVGLKGCRRADVAQAREQA